eukprot:scaffold386_cov135-Skeletonema_menzelii.AAC.3
MASQMNDENIGQEQNLLHCSGDLFNPEEDVKSDVDLYTQATSDLQTFGMFAKFRPVANKKKKNNPTQALDHDDAALFAYIERRSSISHKTSDRRDSRRSSISDKIFDRCDSRSSSRSAMSSSSEGFGDAEGGRRLSSFFGNIGRKSTSDLAGESSFQVVVKQCPSKKGNAVYRRGKIAAENREWEKAVHYYHIALVKQRAYYGEDHINTAETLSCLGLALIEIGEYFGAITALEEALHIRQKLLGPGAEECVLTTNSICRALDRYKQQNIDE